eukprot:SAG31_NODE_3634_length_4036_cov_10.699517_2_plen_56_part_00
MSSPNSTDNTKFKFKLEAGGMPRGPDLGSMMLRQIKHRRRSQAQSRARPAPSASH